MMPLFSVIIPTYNRYHLVQRAVNSVLEQNLDDFEVIVVDDNSDKLLADNLWQDQRVKVIKSSVNRGAGAARNLGIIQSKGRYISFLDDDDIYDKEFLSQTFKNLNKSDPNIGVCWTGAEYFYDYKKLGKQNIGDKREFKASYNHHDDLFEAFLSIGTGFGVTYKRECLEHVGPFSELFTVTEDTELFLRTLKYGYIPQAISETLIYLYDHHDGDRKTSIEHHHARIRECEVLLQLYQIFLKDYKNLELQLENHVVTLYQELEMALASCTV